ncbi:hypothetical protein LTR66_013818 [Elasticomyces elasticus]|nr:hypothetical protein LTR66_013818 [Elasticomyces elasticus]
MEERSIGKRDLVCLNRGPGFKRADLTSRIDAYCAQHQGWVVKNGYSFVDTQGIHGYHLHIGALGHGGCTWTIDNTCYSQLRKPLDQCNTEGANGKQGGIYTDQCASWYLTFG